MTRKISAALSVLFLACVITPLDNNFFGVILQPDPAFAQGTLVLEDFALYSQKEIKLDNIGESRGNIGSNGSIDIKKGAPGSVLGSFQALGDIKNEAEIGIYGDVTARLIQDKGSLSVSGQKIERADLTPLTLPASSFSASGPDLEVPEKSSMTIVPGSYGRLKVKKGAAAHLSNGAYYFVKFELDESAALDLDVSSGAIQINVIEKIKLKNNVDMQIVGGNTDKVLLNYRGTDNIKVEDHAVLRGILTAASAKVEFKKGSRLEGAVYADSIYLEKGASFRHYAAGMDGRPPTADAGGYQTALTGGQVELDGSGSSDPDGDAVTYHWSFVSFPDGSSPALSDPADPMPTFTADLPGVYVIELAVDDGTYASLRNTTTVTAVSELLDVTNFVLYADDKIKMDEISGGTGNLGANRHIHIEKGPSGTITGDLSVLDHIKNDGDITIDGDVITNSLVDDHGTLTVTGQKIENARITPRLLPPLSFSAEGPDFKVPESESQTLAPDSYGRVEVKKGATLQFAAGSYFLREFKTDDSVILVFDVSGGAIELNVVKKLEFGKDADLRIKDGSTRDVLINYAGKKEVEIKDRGVFRGTLVAPGAKVEFEKGSRLEGAVYAKNISLHKGVNFQFHENSPPVADIQAVSAMEDTPSRIILNGSDPDGDSLAFNVMSQPIHGTLAGTAPDLIYTPDENYNGADAFSFTVNDGTVDSGPATVSITVAAVNDAPIAKAQTISLNEDESTPVVLAALDVDADALAYAIDSAPIHGTLTGEGPNLTYLPDSNYNGVDSLTFKVNDGQLDSQIATVSITINPVNDAPIAVVDIVTTNEDRELGAISVLANDTDVDGDTLLPAGFGPPSHGTVVDNGDGTCSYTPDPDYHGTDTFTYTISDGRGGSAEANVKVTVIPVNDAPAAVDDSLNTDEDAALTVAVLANDSDVDGDPLVIASTSQGANGAVSITSDARITYTPKTDFNGTDSFIYTLEDREGGSDTATVSVIVNPVNDAPAATAQSVALGEDTSMGILLRGSDVEGNTLAYEVVGQPSKGTLSGTAPDLTYTPDENYNGADAFSFKVNDGTVDSDPATVDIIVAAINDSPVADAGSDQTVLAGDTVSLDSIGSSDVDGDSLSYQWLFSSVPAGSTAELSNSSAADPGFVPDFVGTYAVQLIVNDGTVNSAVDTVVITVDPRMTTVPNVTGLVRADAESALLGATLSVGTVSAEYSDAFPADHIISQTPAAGAAEIEGSAVALIVSLGPAMVTIPDVVGRTQTAAQAAIADTNLIVGTVSAANSNTVPADHVISQNPVSGSSMQAGSAVDLVISLGPVLPPAVTFNAGSMTIDEGQSTDLSWTTTGGQYAHIDNGIGSVALNNSLTVAPAHTTTYTLTVSGLGGTTSKSLTIAVHGLVDLQPQGSFGQQYEDLVPPDATVDQYDPKRFALITGLVQDSAGAPLSNVFITIHNYLEYGTVTTDSLGRFSIPVEGGGALTVVYEKQGLISAQRKVYVPWNETAIAETVLMVAEDTASTTLTFDGNADTVVTHKSEDVVDESGTRAVTMVFSGNNKAYLVNEQGTAVQELTTITIRATEYTTPASMPARLPPTSAFTYCAELSVDGAQRVRFKKPITAFIDNFLGFPVGSIVPVGYYNRDKGLWVPSENGVIVELLDIDTDGVVDALDADGDGQPDDLDGDGSVSSEIRGLGDSQRYTPGATFWRIRMNHFTPFDCNWPFGPPPGAIAPNSGRQPTNDQKKQQGEDAPICLGSYVEEKSRIFHEDISIVGSEFTLHYDSSRVAGYKPGAITIPLSGNTVPDSLLRIIVKMQIAGKTYEKELPAAPNQTTSFEWDGLDHLGKPVTGPVAAHIQIGFVYYGGYFSPSQIGRAFGQPGISSLYVPTRQELTLWKETKIPIIRAKGTLAEGWTLSAHHQIYQLDPSILVKGDGTFNRNSISIIETYAGTGGYGYSGDGGSAVFARFSKPWGLDTDASGNLYIIDNNNGAIRKVDANGIISTHSRIGFSTDLAVDNLGNVYYTNINNLWVKYADGWSERLAGNYRCQYSGDGGPAKSAYFCSPYAVDVDVNGNIYIADSSGYRIRKIDTAGIITTVAGNGLSGHSGDGGPATKARLGQTLDVIADAGGNIYIADSPVVRKVDPSGIISRVAGGGGSPQDIGDGGPATQAYLNGTLALALDDKGNLYIAEYNRVRKVNPNGIITTIAGINSGNAGYGGDGGPPTKALLNNPTSLAVGAEGNIYISDMGNNRIRKVSPPIPRLQGLMEASGLAFTEESGIAHIMSSAGLHEKTIDLDSGVALYQFGYDADNHLVSISDRFGNETLIERDSDGLPTAIITPDGLRTGLGIDANNHLKRISYPGGRFYDLEYTADGLLTVKTEPETNQFFHAYDEKGRLTDSEDEEGGHWQFDRTTDDNGWVHYDIFTEEGNRTSHLDYTESTGAYESMTTAPHGAESTYSRSYDELNAFNYLPCGIQNEFVYDVDSEYKFKYLKQLRQATPEGLLRVWSKTANYTDENADLIPDIITEEIAVNGKTTILTNNILTSQKVLTSPQGRAVFSNYDPDTLVVTKLAVPGLYDVEYGYDARGRLSLVKRNIRETEFAYGSNGFLASVTDSEKKTTFYNYDQSGRLTGISRPDGGFLDFDYDDNGNMTLLTIQATADHGFGYNKVNRKAGYHTPLSGSYAFKYDKDRQLTEIIYPSQKRIVNKYEKTLLDQIQTPDGIIDFTYACGGKVETVTKGDQTITYGYDGKLVTSESLSGTLNQSMDYTYNNDFDVSSFTYAGGTVNYSYDEDGLLTGAGSYTITRNADNGLPETVTDGALNIARTFSGYGEVDAQAITVNSQNAASWSLSRDNKGRITSKSDTVAGVSSGYDYTYDAMGRLLTVTKDNTLVEEYQYDLNGTRIHEMNALRGVAGRSYSYSDEDHLLSAGTVTYAYDLDGFLTTKADGSEVTGYTYSLRGELLNVTLSDGTVIEYVHDPLGRRIAKKLNGAISEKYLWQGLTRLLAVYDGDDNLLMRFEYADGRMPVAVIAEGAAYYFAYDQVGSLRLVADFEGNVIKSIEYDSFGNIVDDSNPTFALPFGFAGGLHDRDTGLVRFGHRDYDPDIGRWTAKDPIGFAGGDTDLYGYVLNDPVNLIDPEGLWVPQAIGAVIGLGFEGYRQYQTGELNAGRLLVAAGTGALGGFGSTLGRALFFGAASNILNTSYHQYSDPCQSFDLGQLGRSGAFGAIGGSIGFGGGAIGKTLFWPSKVIGRPVGRMPSQHFGASGAAFGAATGGYIANQ